MKNFKKVFLLAIICLLIFACSKKNEDNESIYEEMDLQTQKAIVDDMIGLLVYMKNYYLTTHLKKVENYLLPN